LALPPALGFHSLFGSIINRLATFCAKYLEDIHAKGYKFSWKDRVAIPDGILSGFWNNPRIYPLEAGKEEG
jgi:hypothetical protein